jgi:hypothetical protein
MSFQGITMPPPSLGLDLVSPIDNMNPAAALELVNVFPGAGAPTVRLGYERFCSLAETTPIGLMAELPRPNNTSQLIVANSTKLYSISSTGTATNISKTGGYTSGDWNKEIFANNIYLCNGVNNAQVYTGSGVAADLSCSFSGGGSTLDKMVNVNAYRERLYFIEKDTFKVWYHDTVRAVFTSGSPTLKSYDFQFNMKRGGYLLFTTSYTNQTAATAADYFVAVSSEGEIVMYQGNSPDDSTTPWQPVAHFFIGKPLGPKAYIRINQDTWIITDQGIVPLSALFQLDPEQAVNVVSQNINPVIAEFSTISGRSSSWHGFFWPTGRRIYVSIPDSENTSFFMVYSIDTKAWTKFILNDVAHGIMSCKFLSLPFYGSLDGKIYKGETGFADVVTSTSTGEPINFEGRCAFSFYESRGNYKAFKDIRPLLKTRKGITLSLGLDTDFKRQDIVGSITTPISNFTAWGSRWGSNGVAHTPYRYPSDSPASPITVTAFFQPWSADVDYVFDRYATLGQGHCAAIRFGGSVKNSSLTIYGFEVRFIVGGQV